MRLSRPTPFLSAPLLCLMLLSAPLMAQDQLAVTPPEAPASGAAPSPAPPATRAPTATPAPVQPAPVQPAPMQPAPQLAQTQPPQTQAPALAPPPAGSIPHDLSLRGMYDQAHWVVKAVMISLLVAAFLCWTVWLYKSVELWLARRALRQSQALLHRGPGLTEATAALATRRDPAALMARAVAEEWARSAPAIATAGGQGLKDRAASLVARLEGQAIARLRRGTGLLATIGATAPFVGLFGTVWGIMNAFIGIAETRTTNLAVVAPGIAEALLATAIGLVAAIPAVVIYNHFARSIAGYRLGLGDAGATILRHLSRDLDLKKG